MSEGTDCEAPVDQMAEDDADSGAHDEEEPPAKKRREKVNPMAAYRRFMTPAEDGKDTKGNTVKRVHCEVCNQDLLDNAHTIKKHTGYHGTDVDGVPKYAPNNRHQQKVAAHEARLIRLQAGGRSALSLCSVAC